MVQPVIVVPAYNRAQPLARLLKSINAADYPEGVKLFISLEGGASDEVKCLACEFSSPQLDVEVIQRPERLGLRNHLLLCGDFALEFGAVIILEDDLLVDRFFYHYAAEALHHYRDEASVAGVALYAPEYNEYAGLPFRAMENGYSTYPIQVPCSWGQCWTASQWRQFRKWYAGANSETVCDTYGLPGVVKGWPESSWKKYFAAYLVQTNRFFIYPYQTYSTNCSDPGGTHIIHGSGLFQVSFAFQGRPLPVFSFCPLAHVEVGYDAFMEPSGNNVYRELGLSKGDVEIDTLGIKPVELLCQKTYTLTCRKVCSFINKYPRSYRPVEYNFAHKGENVDQNFFSLTNSLHIIPSGDHERSLAEFSYFAGLNVASRMIIQQIFKALPNIIGRYIMKKI